MRLLFLRRYNSQDDRPHNVVPGFPGTLPRTITRNQTLLGSGNGQDGEILVNYEINPIYDSANGKINIKAVYN